MAIGVHQRFPASPSLEGEVRTAGKRDPDTTADLEAVIPSNPRKG